MFRFHLGCLGLWEAKRSAAWLAEENRPKAVTVLSISRGHGARSQALAAQIIKAGA